MPAIGFTLKYDDFTDKNFIRSNDSFITNLKSQYTFDFDFRAKSFDGTNWIASNGQTDNNMWADYNDKFKWIGGKPPSRKYNEGAFFLLEYNAENGRFEKTD